MLSVLAVDQQVFKRTKQIEIQYFKARWAADAHIIRYSSHWGESTLFHFAASCYTINITKNKVNKIISLGGTYSEEGWMWRNVEYMSVEFLVVEL